MLSGFDAPHTSFPEFLAQAGPDDVVITAGNRLAVEIRGRLARRLRAGAVLLPEVVPYAQWLRGVWSQLRFQESFHPASPIADATLLTASQESLLWEQVLRESGAADRLLFLEETVDACMRATALAELYAIPWEHPAWERDEESRAFRTWYQRVRARCREERWMLPARLPAFLAPRLQEVPGLANRRILLAGFDEIEPGNAALFEALSRVAARLAILETRDSSRTEAELRLLSAADAGEELRAAAEWAAAALQAQPDARLVIVIPDLGSRRVEAEESLLEALHPGWQIGGAIPSNRRFNLSLGEPLSANPVAAAGLRLMDWLETGGTAEGGCLLADARALLRCPYFAREPQERFARGKLEALLLKKRNDRVPLRLLREMSLLAERVSGEPLAAWRDAIGLVEEFDASGEAAPSAWAERVRALWLQVLWLGDPSLSSAEFQARHRTLEELGRMAELDVVQPHIAFREFASRLKQQFRGAAYQPESRPAPVLVAGLFEVTGLSFDAAWVCGLNDTVLPRLPQPDPFLPRLLQREGNLPGSSAAREIAFGSRVFDRLRGLAPRLVLSFPERREQEELEPSPFLRGLATERGAPVERLATPLRYPALPRVAVEEIADQDGGPLGEDELLVKRGVQVLADQSDCPFRAFARSRLACDPQEAESELMNRLDQGSFLHRALEEFWQRTRSLDALRSLSAGELDARIGECAEIALRDFEVAQGSELAAAQREAERIRIADRMNHWLEFEMQRQPFRVAAMEKGHREQFGGLSLGIRPDRVDELPDGSVVLVDYKTGHVDPKQWEGERPAQPQLLAYLAAEQRPVSALAFASLKTGKTGWKAKGRHLAADFLASSRAAGENPDWATFVHESKDTVERLASGFRAGMAAVDPAADREPCKYCEQKPLCRIAEWRRDGDEPGEAEEGDQG